MGFNSKSFIDTKYVPRTFKVPVPALKDFFDKADKPEFEVRGLTGVEIGQTNEAINGYDNKVAIVEALLSQQKEEIVSAIKKFIGVSDDVAKDTALSFEQMILACVNPKVDLQLVKKICKVSPGSFTLISNKIRYLSAQGYIPGKPKPSGKITESK